MEGIPSDGQLLNAHLDGGAIDAFNLIVTRYGKMVYNVCARILGESHEAEDATQAVFLTLLQKAHRLRNQPNIGAWLHHVACCIARNARKAKLRRRALEGNSAPPKTSETENVWENLKPLLDEELNALPERYRLPLILHHLNGLPIQEASNYMGCKTGTFASRLGRGKELLRKRLQRRGLSCSAALLGTLLSEHGLAIEWPETLNCSTFDTAAPTHPKIPGDYRDSITTLTKGALDMLYWESVRQMAKVCGLALILGLGSSLLALQVGASELQGSPAPEPQDPSETVGATEKRNVSAENRRLPETWRLRVRMKKETLSFLMDGSNRKATKADPVVASRLPWVGVRSPDGESLLYVERSDGDHEIVRVDGDQVKKLTDNSDRDSNPSWSTDGTRIIYSFSSIKNRVRNLYTLNLKNGKRTKVPGSDNAERGVFAQDGRILFRVVRQYVRMSIPYSDLMISDGRNAKVLVKGEQITDFAASPKDHKVAVGCLGKLLICDLNTGQARKIAHTFIHRNLTSHSTGSIVWRPDGKALACRMWLMAQRSVGGPPIFGDRELFVVPLNYDSATWFIPTNSQDRYELDWMLVP